jgi:hypothetical protein
VASKPIRPRPIRKPKGGALAELLDQVEQHLRRFVVFPGVDPAEGVDAVDAVDGSRGVKSNGREQSAAVTLWIAHAHVADVFHVTPRLLILSAEPDSGKSTLLECAEQLCPAAVKTSNISAASLYRSVESELAKSFFVDEADGLYKTATRSERAQDVTTFINSGYRKGDYTIRCVGKAQTPTKFRTFAPVGMGALDTGFLPDTVTSRSIPIRLKAKKRNEYVEEFLPEDVEPEASELRTG